MPPSGDASPTPHPFVTADALDQLLGLLGEAVAVVRADGRIVYRSPPAAALLEGRNGRAIRGEVLAAAGRALGCPGVSAAPTDAAHERALRVRRMPGSVHDGPLAVIVLARPPADLPEAEELMWRFGLTAREASVARLLAEGHENASVARALGIRDTTARHYTESVLLKLGVRSRAAVAAALLGTQRRPDEPGRALTTGVPVDGAVRIVGG